LLLALASIVILGFRSRRDFNQDFIFLIDMNAFEKWGLLFDEGKSRSFCGGAAFLAS
jgi:hypothetical protein